MNKLEKAKTIIKENFSNARYGIFNSHNIVGDFMANLYTSDKLVVNICPYYEYFEVFGLSQNEFEKLKEFYHSLKED